jgi:acyl carrier protein
MKHLQFILALEHEFDLTLAPEDIESLVTVGNVEDLARARTA